MDRVSVLVGRVLLLPAWLRSTSALVSQTSP